MTLNRSVLFDIVGGWRMAVVVVTDAIDCLPTVMLLLIRRSAPRRVSLSL